MAVHVPVLLKEVIDGLDFKKEDKIFLDATFGGGGHSLEICKKFPWVKVVGFDVDKNAVERGEKILKENVCQFEIVQENFRNLGKALSDLKISQIDKALFDLGFSSDQIAGSGRGLSFQKDEPLIMTLRSDWEDGLTAYEIVNSWPQEALEKILREYGEESFWRKIAANIVRSRKSESIKTTSELVKIIEESLPKSFGRKKIHPATKTFQALRIAVNDELGSLEIGLESAWKKLKKEGRIAVISFHSLEDRIVKNFFRELKDKEEAILINKKPIIATREETQKNPRSRSAKLRIIQKQ